MKNRITYIKRTVSDETITILSIPRSYLITGIHFLIIGILDFVFLGYHIGHPGEDGIGTHIGQGSAVFLGGISFAWTIGLAPLIVGAIMIVYCIYASKQLILSRSDRTFLIQERRLFFPFVTELEQSSIKEIKYTNTGLKLRHIWIILFIPIGIRVLQFGIPLFGEHLAQDEILPTMMLLTGVITLMGTVITLLTPTHTLTFRSETKKYSVNFYPILKKGKKTISQLFNLEKNSSKRSEKGFLYLRLLGGIGLIAASIVGLSLEYLWGTDLSMVGITYGIYLVFHVVQKDLNLFGYFSNTSLLNDIVPEQKFRKLGFIDGVAIWLIGYLTTLEFIWGWVYFVDPNALLIVEMMLTTIIWLGILFWIFVYVAIPFRKMKHLKEWVKADKTFRTQLIVRGIGLLLCIILLLFKIF